MPVGAGGWDKAMRRGREFGRKDLGSLLEMGWGCEGKLQQVVF